MIEQYRLSEGVTEVQVSFGVKEKAVLVFPLWNTLNPRTHILTMAYLMWNKKRKYFIAIQDIRQDGTKIIRLPLIYVNSKPTGADLLND